MNQPSIFRYRKITLFLAGFMNLFIIFVFLFFLVSYFFKDSLSFYGELEDYRLVLGRYFILMIVVMVSLTIIRRTKPRDDTHHTIMLFSVLLILGFMVYLHLDFFELIRMENYTGQDINDLETIYANGIVGIYYPFIDVVNLPATTDPGTVFNEFFPKNYMQVTETSAFWYSLLILSIFDLIAIGYAFMDNDDLDRSKHKNRTRW